MQTIAKTSTTLITQATMLFRVPGMRQSDGGRRGHVRGAGDQSPALSKRAELAKCARIIEPAKFLLVRSVDSGELAPSGADIRQLSQAALDRLMSLRGTSVTNRQTGMQIGLTVKVRRSHPAGWAATCFVRCPPSRTCFARAFTLEEPQQKARHPRVP